MAGEGVATPGTAGAGLFSSLGTTPRRVVSDPDYIYTPASLLDWLKEFKGAIAAAMPPVQPYPRPPALCATVPFSQRTRYSWPKQRNANSRRDLDHEWQPGPWIT